MTYLKSTSIAMALTAILGASSAFAGDTPPSFSELDADANGQVSLSEFAKHNEKKGKTLTNAQRQFNVISAGNESFTADQYESSFAVKGEVDARDTDPVVVMPSEPTSVKGAVDSGAVVDEFDETPEAEAQVQDKQTMSDDVVQVEDEDIEADVEVETGATNTETKSMVKTTLRKSKLQTLTP